MHIGGVMKYFTEKHDIIKRNPGMANGAGSAMCARNEVIDGEI
jgi:hypothetical protein